MVIAVRTILVALVPLLRVLSKALAALFAREGDLEALQQRVRLGLAVTGAAVEPFLAAGAAQGDLGVENVFAGERRGVRAFALLC